MSSASTEQGPYAGAMMRVIVEWVQRLMFTAVRDAGYTDLSPAHVRVFRYPSPDGLRPSELADQLQITKQSVNDLLGYLERRGFLARELDPRDGRARIVHLTPQGRELYSVIRKAAQSADEQIASLLGTSRFGDLRRSLETVKNSIDDTGRTLVHTERIS